MPHYRVMVEQIVYTPMFKVIEAATQEEANAAGWNEIDRMTLAQEPTDLGWDTSGDTSTEYEPRPEVIEELPPTKLSPVGTTLYLAVRHGQAHYVSVPE